MDSKILNTLTAEIARRFPEFAGCRPSVQPKPGDQVLLIFKVSKQTADSRSIARTVRVLASANGRIQKITTSK